MFKRLSFLATTILISVFNANAQSDTSYYDLGRVSVKKDFTQTITIKGSDLEHYQFSDLADAVNVWLYGTYSNQFNLLYVIDGNIITDANAYSIYDVDEVTLIQSAAVNVSGAAPGAQVVLVKLKTNRSGKQGIEAAGQANLVNLRNSANIPNQTSTHNIYDQFYLSGYKNFDNVHLGLSADYQHDVSPVLTNGTLKTLDPYNINRLKFNGYADAKLWSGTTLNFDINYVPQTDGYGYTYGDPTNLATQSEYYHLGAVQHMAGANLALKSKITGGLTNTLSGAYNHYNLFGMDTTYTLFPSTGGEKNFDVEKSHSEINTSNLLIRDNLAYHTMLGVFDAEPSLNFSFRRLYSTMSNSDFYGSGYGDGIPSAYNSSYSFNGGGEKLYFLTPSLDIHYKDAADIQGGFSDILNSAKNSGSNYTYSRQAPFLSLSADVFKLASLANMSLRLFGSFSRQSQLFDDGSASLSGITPFVYLVTNATIGYYSTNTTDAVPYYQQRNPYQQYNTFQAGFDLTFVKNLVLSYNYWDYQSQDQLVELIPYGANGSESVLLYYYDKVVTNRIALNYTVNAAGFNWRPGLNVTEAKVQPDEPIYNGFTSYLGDGHRYSGGFTNRFTCGPLFAGLDILYQFGERPLTLQSVTIENLAAPPHVNSVSLQSLYFGTRLKINQTKYAELFVNTRNILQNNSSDITDNRRFYGLGFKVDL
jgi:hypothetical protein